MSYRSISLINYITGNMNKPRVLTLSGQISTDTFVGFITGLRSMIMENYYLPHGSVILRAIDSLGRNIDIDLVENNISIVQEYLEYRDIHRDNLSMYYVPEKYFGWWIFNPSTETYSLYKFLTTDFIQGFISAFNNFNIDFRKYIAGPPFQTQLSSNNIKQNIFYNVLGYDISPLIKVNRPPAPVGPYYTYQYEEYDRTGPEPEHITDQLNTEYPLDYE